MILDGRRAAATIQNELRENISKLNGRPPCLAAVLTTDHPASHTYVKRKVAACKEVGITSKVIQVSPQTTEELLQLVDELNNDPEVDGILIQLPLPDGLDVMRVLERIDPKKDVDGFHPTNVGKVVLSDPTAMHPCTPLGIKVLLQHYEIEVAKKHVVIIGRSNIVGKPLAALLLQNAPGANATVTVAHRYTSDLAAIARTADILVVAVGQPDLVHADMVREGAVVVDVGINRKSDPSTSKGYKIVGDVDFDTVAPRTSAITPVPGGVGPMTIAMLLSNTLKAYNSRS